MRIAAVVILAFFATNLISQDLSGTWNGALDIQGMKLRLVFHITEEGGKYTSLMDSPDQNAFGIKTDETIIDGNNIEIIINNLRAKVNGVYNLEKNAIDAKFTQAGMQLPLELIREEIEAVKYNRPQEPTTFDYIVEEVTFDHLSGSHKLAGTLTIPKSGNFEKVAILVSGSGPQDRNEELLQHKPFLVLSDYLTRNGIAVLRYDDRGVGESGGNFASATSDDLATDAEAALAFLRGREDMKGKKMGIVGHSEGGMIAPVVASRNEIDYIVLLAGPGTPLDVLLKDQTMLIGKAGGESEEDLNRNLGMLDIVYEVLRANKSDDNETLKTKLRPPLVESLETLPDSVRNSMGNVDELVDGMLQSMANEWFRYFVDFNPKDYLIKVKCPVLAVNGSLDLQVPAEDNLKAIGKYLSEGGNTNYTIKAFPRLNHLFQESETGSPAEYILIEETFNERALEYVGNWIHHFDL